MKHHLQLWSYIHGAEAENNTSHDTLMFQHVLVWLPWCLKKESAWRLVEGSDLDCWPTWSHRWSWRPSAAARSSSVASTPDGACSVWCWSSPLQRPRGQQWLFPVRWWCCPAQQTDTQHVINICLYCTGLCLASFSVSSLTSHCYFHLIFPAVVTFTTHRLWQQPL